MFFVPFGDGWFRAIAWDRLREQAPLREPVTLEEIRDAFRRIAGEDFGMTRDALELEVSQRARQAGTTGSGRVFWPATLRTCIPRSAVRA